jgi:hypothetical protein
MILFKKLKKLEKKIIFNLLKKIIEIKNLMKNNLIIFSQKKV